MSVQVSWYDDAHTIVLQAFSPGWTWEDFDRAHDQTFALIASAGNAASFITDLRTAPSPPTPNIIGHLQRITRNLPATVTQIVVVGPGPFMRLMGDIFVNAMGSFGKKVSFAESLDAAGLIIHDKMSEAVAKPIH